MSAPMAVEDRLRALADELAWPPTPDLRPGVAERIAGQAPERIAASTPERIAGRTSRRRLVLALALAGALLLALAGIAAALRLGVAGLEITRETPAKDITPVTSLDLVPGSPVPLADARAVEPPRILVPGDLPAPATAFVDGTGTGRTVTLAWQAAPGTPDLDGSGLALVLLAAPGRVEPPLLAKVLGRGTTIEPVTVGGDPGWWLAGAPHELLVEGANGGMRVLRVRYAGDTLVFARDGTVYRLESALGRDRTLEIAASLR